jgi:hypothetical protein
MRFDLMGFDKDIAKRLSLNWENYHQESIRVIAAREYWSPRMHELLREVDDLIREQSRRQSWRIGLGAFAVIALLAMLIYWASIP